VVSGVLEPASFARGVFLAEFVSHHGLRPDTEDDPFRKRADTTVQVLVEISATLST
jgi:hypothetical protein